MRVHDRKKPSFANRPQARRPAAPLAGLLAALLMLALTGCGETGAASRAGTDGTGTAAGQAAASTDAAPSGSTAATMSAQTAPSASGVTDRTDAAASKITAARTTVAKATAAPIITTSKTTATPTTTVTPTTTADNRSLAQRLEAQNIAVPAHANTGKHDQEVSSLTGCEYAVWVNGSNGAAYSCAATISCGGMTNPVTLTIEVWMLVTNAPKDGAIGLTSSIAGGKSLSVDPKPVQKGELVHHTLHLTLQKGGSNKGYHLTLVRNPLKLGGEIFSLSLLSGSYALS